MEQHAGSTLVKYTSAAPSPDGHQGYGSRVHTLQLSQADWLVWWYTTTEL